MINKADLMSDEIRAIWASWLKENNLPFVFFSAIAEQAKILKEEQEMRSNQKTALELKDQKNEQMRKQEVKKDVLDLLRLDDEIDEQHKQELVQELGAREDVQEEKEVMELLAWKPVLSSDQILDKQQLLALLDEF